MAGSLNHITAEDGSFTLCTIENHGDAVEALEECFQIIAWLLPYAARGLDNGTASGALIEACHHLGFPSPRATPVLYKEKTA